MLLLMGGDQEVFVSVSDVGGIVGVGHVVDVTVVGVEVLATGGDDVVSDVVTTRDMVGAVASVIGDVISAVAAWCCS